MMDKRARDRYSRQTILPEVGEEGQARLSRGRAVIIGCGALGCNIASLLVRAGVGRIRIVDRDFIEYHNLQRQVLFDEDDIKAELPKAIAAERHLRKVNSLVDVEGIVADVNCTNIETFCRGADVILDGLDNMVTRYLINDVALKHKIPWVYGGALATSGMTATIVPGRTPCFRCLQLAPSSSETMLTCETAGILGTVPALIGSIEATEAIKILVGVKEMDARLITIDLWDRDVRYLKTSFRDNCPACHGKYEFLEERFHIRTTSLCGQRRAVQVVNAKVNRIALDELAERLENVGEVKRYEFMLRFNVDRYEVVVFPDGRAIVKNTIDESLAKELYLKYIGDG